jgi:hypothetical protein
MCYLTLDYRRLSGIFDYTCVIYIIINKDRCRYHWETCDYLFRCWYLPPVLFASGRISKNSVCQITSVNSADNVSKSYTSWLAVRVLNTVGYERERESLRVRYATRRSPLWRTHTFYIIHGGRLSTATRQVYYKWLQWVQYVSLSSPDRANVSMGKSRMVKPPSFSLLRAQF